MSSPKPNIPYHFFPVPQELMIDEFLDDPKMMRLIKYIFKRIRTHPHQEKIKSNGWHNVDLESFEFIFGRDACIKETGLTAQELRTRMATLVTSSFVRVSTSRSTSSFTVYRLMTESFKQNGNQQINQQINQQFNHKEEAKIKSDKEYIAKKESDKEKIIPLTSSPARKSPPANRSLSFSKEKKEQATVSSEDLDGLMAYCQGFDLIIEPKCMKRWLSKHGREKVIANLGLMRKRGAEEHEKWMEKALKEDWAGEQERIKENRSLAERLKTTTSWHSLTITQNYCRDENTCKELYFKMDEVAFKDAIKCIRHSREDVL